MKSLFDSEGPLVSFLTTLCNLMIVNLLTFMLCLPVVTAGAAFTAADYVLYHMVQKTDSYIVRSYFKSFRENFRQATVIWLLYLLVIVTGAMDVYIIRHSETQVSSGLVVVLVVIAAVFLSGMIYTFAYLMRYTDRTGTVLKNAWILDFSNLPRSALMVVVTGGAIYAAVRFYVYLLPIYMLLGIAGTGMFDMYLMKGIFEKLENPHGREAENT